MFRNISPDLIMMALDSMDDDELDVVMVMHNYDEDGQFRQRHTRGFNLDRMDDEQCWSNFRFRKADIPRLAEGLRLAEHIKTLNGLKVPRIEAICILLRRLAYPNRLQDISPLFRRCKEDISYIASAVLDDIHRGHNHLLKTLRREWVNIHTLSAAIQQKGAPLANCIGFIDGTVRPIARPSEYQREVYNGHKRTHALKYQSVMMPNGIIAHMHGPISGRRHDAALLGESNLLQELTALGQDVCIYGDPAYPLNQHLIVGFRGANITPEQQAFNTKMSALRTSVEWGFGGVLGLFAFLDFKKNQKLLLQPVGKQYLVAVILFNCHTCLYGNTTSSFFLCDPPRLEEYLQPNA